MITLNLLPIGRQVRFTYTNKKGETKIVTGTVTDQTETSKGPRTWIWDGITEWKGEPMPKQYDPAAATSVVVL